MVLDLDYGVSTLHAKVGGMRVILSFFPITLLLIHLPPY
jgi:hypothetical protein